uniref:Uncharacterized protein n=1 Tax=Physcomitrium patens TaxID=3218 RepID=A0A2K1JT43_PHYPA|nr:hypothetical protein PHYPA_014469 [Physcomitrium patens]
MKGSHQQWCSGLGTTPLVILGHRNWWVLPFGEGMTAQASAERGLIQVRHSLECLLDSSVDRGVQLSIEVCGVASSF